MIRRGLVFAVLAITGDAFCASPQAVVNADSLPVYANASADSRILISLSRGEVVSIELVVSGPDGQWCQIRRTNPAPASGYVDCGELKQVAEPKTTRRVEQLNPDAAIGEAIQLAAIHEQFAHVSDPNLYAASFRKQLSPGQSAELTAIVTRFLRPETFERAVRATLQKNYSAELFPQLLEQLRSQLARRMSQIETGQVNPQSLAVFLTEMSKTPPNTARLELIRRLARASGSDSPQTDVVLTVVRTMAEALNSSAAPKKAVTEQQLAQTIEEIKTRYGPELERSALAHLLYIYRSVPDEELNRYAGLLESPPMHWFNTVVYQGMLYGIQLMTTQLVPAVLQHFHIDLSR